MVFGRERFFFQNEVYTCRQFVKGMSNEENCGVSSLIFRSPPTALMSLLSTQEDLLENVLGCIPVGQIVTIKPLSEDFCYVLGYLLTWKLILTFFKASSSQVNKCDSFLQFCPICVFLSSHLDEKGNDILI